MNKLKNKSAVLLTTCLLSCLSFCMSAQVKTGFKLLEKKDSSGAKLAFEKDTTNPKYALAAQYGLFLLAEKKLPTKPLKEQLEALKKLRTMEQQMTQLSPRQLRKLDKLNASPYYVRVLRGRLLPRITKVMAKDWALLDYDKFVKEEPALVKDFGVYLKRARIKIVKEAYVTARDYPTLYSLVKNHLSVLQTENLNMADRFESKLFSAFIAEKGIVQLDEFIKEFPDHRVSKDCWAKELGAVYQKSGRQGGLQFLSQYRLSLLDIFVVEDILWHENELKNLSAEEQKQLDALHKRSEIESNFRKMPTETLYSETITYIESQAPSRHSYELMQKVMQQFIDSDNLPKAIALLDNVQKLYPDAMPDKKNCGAFTYYVEKQIWFDTARSILKRPEGSLEKKPLTEINTSGEEFSPVVTADGNLLYFCGSDRYEDEEADGEDVYVSKKVNGVWEKPKIVAELSGEGNQAPLSITPDGLTMLMFVDGKLHISVRRKGKWLAPRPLYTINNAFAWVGKATLSADGKVLVFEASKNVNAMSGINNIDLYMSRLRDTTWMTPTLLPSFINTRYDERSPYLHTDGKTLYFASNGQGGLGHIDIFKTTLLDKSWQRWSKPYNIGRKFNTIYDDWGINFSVSAKGDIGYLSSAPERRYDIFSISMPQTAQPEPVEVVALPIKSGKNLPSVYTLTLYNRKGEILKKEEVHLEDNRVIMTFPKDSATRFTLEAEKTFPHNGVVAQYQYSSLDSVGLVVIDSMLKNKIAVPIPAIEFETNSDALRAESLPHLDFLAKFLSKKPWKVTIIGHTDDRGTPEHNKELSLLRAFAVETYLKKNLLNMQFETIGLGSTQPKMVGTTEDIRRMNRRVEIQIQEILPNKTAKGN